MLVSYSNRIEMWDILEIKMPDPASVLLFEMSYLFPPFFYLLSSFLMIPDGYRRANKEK
jgi:hypothetical protein